MSATGAATVGSHEWLVACEQIRQLASRYAVTMNHRDLEALVQLFVPDVLVSRENSGRDALRASFEQQLRPLGRSILQVTNQVIDFVDDTHATGIVGSRGEIELLDGDTGAWVVQVIEYHDTYERREGRWLFVRRRHYLWYGAPSTTSPIGLPPANWPASAVGSGDLPDALPSWQRWTERR